MLDVCLRGSRQERIDDLWKLSCGGRCAGGSEGNGRNANKYLQPTRFHRQFYTYVHKEMTFEKNLVDTVMPLVAAWCRGGATYCMLAPSPLPLPPFLPSFLKPAYPSCSTGRTHYAVLKDPRGTQHFFSRKVLRMS